jgi:hypothetical protein
VGGIRIRGGRTQAADSDDEERAPPVNLRDDEDAPREPAGRPLRRAGSRESAAAAVGDTAHTDPPVGGEAERQERERRVTPNVIQNQPAAASTAGERERLRRERATTPTVIQPQAPADTTPRRTP